MARDDLSEVEDITEKAQEAGAAFYEKFKTQRVEWEEIWQVNDYMAKAAQNRTLNSSEGIKGVNPAWSTGPRAQTGSTIFFQQYRQLGSQLSSVALSRDVPFSYSPVANEAVFMSAEDADAQASQWNTLAKWTLKKDGFARKFISFANQLRKYGNIPVLFYQNQKVGTRTIMEPQYEVTAGIDGQPIINEGEAIEREEEVVAENWPSWRALNVDGIFADVFIGNLQDQDCVVLPYLATKAKMLEKVRSEEWNEKQVEKITSAIKWDGTTNAQLKKQKIENQGMTPPQTDATDQYLVWDIFQRMPIDGKKWDDEAMVADWYWYTVVGNNIKDGIPVRFHRNEDPDDEVPVFMMHALPDDDDILYHVSEGQIIRSNYSVECTLKNQMIDNNSAINNPPMREIDGEVRGTDRQYGPDKTFVMDRDNSLTEFDVKSLTVDNIQALNYINEDTKRALFTAGNMIGEAYGGRTSALEAGNAYKNSVQPHMITVRYILEQFLGVYARKMHSYWSKYAYPGQVMTISDEEQIQSVYPSGMYGEFDINIDIIDEFEEDVVKSQRLYDTISLVAGNPELMKAIDAPELLTEWLKKSKIKHAKIVHRPLDYDAQEVARNENIAMINGNIPAQVKQGENLTLHLATHEGERLRYNGLEEQYPSVVLLDQHIAETKLAAQSGQQSQGTPPAPNESEGAGELGGNQIAAALGGVQ